MELPKETSLDKLSVRADASEKLSFDAPLNSKDVQEVLKSRFDSLDRDGNGFVTGAELIKGLNDSQYGSLAYRALYAAFKNVRDLEESSNDEWGDENDGITGKDINAISKEGKILDRLNQTIAAMNADAEGITDHSADNARVAAAGRAIREATRRDNLIDTGTDDKAITDTLANLSESDRHELKKFYKSMYGITLRKELEGEMSGSDLDKTVNLLARREGESDDAGFMHELLLEHGEWFGRSKKALSRALIDKVSTMSTADIERACREYRSRYGQGLENAFRGSGLGETTKASLEIYMKGADARGVEDTLALADQALSKKDLEMFVVSMRSASPEARQRFLEADGESRIKRAFGRPSRRAQSQTHRLEKLEASEFASTREVRHAMEFARQGRLSTSTLVQESTSWAGDNEKAIETALSQMSDSERKTYQAGRTIKSNEKVSGLNDEERQRALEFYEDLHNALDAAGNSTELARWEDHIFHKGGSLVGELAEHRGRIYDDSTDTIISSIENMDRKDWQRLKNDTDYRGQIEGMLSTYLTKGQMNRVAEVLDLKQVEKTYEESSRNGRRSVIDVIKDNKHRGFLFLDNKEEGIWGAIEKMTPEEKRRYREEPAFAEKLDRELRFSLDQGVELEIARSMLEKVRRLQEPEMEIFDKLGVYSRNFSVDEGKVVREVEAAFRDDPQLFKRVSKPENDEEREFS
ncbi:MAG: hypothetical protein K8F91_26075, partial [Candidatus Obscuribacterales bacterium]|nr:hypothetical protein [Candidatus Obscuribacterales bacterium]